jgi:hypothetical protein
MCCRPGPLGERAAARPEIRYGHAHIASTFPVLLLEVGGTGGRRCLEKSASAAAS